MEYVPNAAQLYTHFQALSNELSTPKIVICPSDPGKTDATNWMASFTNGAKGTGKGGNTTISYSVGTDAQETYPQSFLSSDRNMFNPQANPARTTNDVDKGMVTDMKVGPIAQTQNAGWDSQVHQNQGNACMGDGSVQQLSSARLREQLRNTGTTSNTFVFPASGK